MDTLFLHYVSLQMCDYIINYYCFSGTLVGIVSISLHTHSK